jgi:hypothetical protein
LRDRQQILGMAQYLGSGVVALFSILTLSGCVSASGKEHQSAASQKTGSLAAGLADSLNAKSAASRKMQADYRDRLVRSMGGAKLAEQQPALASPAALPGSAASGQAAIGSLVMQPTAINASRSSIYSSPDLPGGQPPDGPSQPQRGGSGFPSIYAIPAASASPPPHQPVPIRPAAGRTSQNRDGGVAAPQGAAESSGALPASLEPTCAATSPGEPLQPEAPTANVPCD